MKQLRSLETMIFAFSVPAASTVEKHERIKADGTVQEIRARFYSGQQLALHVRPYVKKKGNMDQDLVTYPEGNSAYLAGEDDYFVIPAIIEVQNDDEIYIQAVNIDPLNAYDCICHVIIDYFGGRQRVIGGLM